VASVSCIYGLGSPEEYKKVHLALSVGAPYTRADLTRDLVHIHFTRTNADLTPGLFRARGNTLEVMPVNERTIWRFTLSTEGIGTIEELDPISRQIRATPSSVFLFPAKHFITSEHERARALRDIQEELALQLATFEREGKVLERERLKRRTAHDLALIKEVGYCNGIENYSRHFDGRTSGEAPHTLLSYFPRLSDGTPDFLTIIDESHVAIPQLAGMYAGDRSRKETLVAHGFRLPSALDNRPLRFEEFEARVGACIYTSATPGAYEYEKCCVPKEGVVRSKKEIREKRVKGEEKETRECPFVVEQVIRPTGLLDPKVEVRPIVGREGYAGQIEDFITETLRAVEKDERVLVTTLTKKMAEDLATFLKDRGVRAEYLHSDIKTIERIEILTSFRKGIFDVLVGVNLLREGLDLPEVALVGILDADKEGFLRSETALIQTIGRAARNVQGRVILYADEETPSMAHAIAETERRRTKQEAYNKEHNITPRSVHKAIADITDRLQKERSVAVNVLQAVEGVDKKTKATLLREKKAEMKRAVEHLDFETAAIVRDEIRLLEGEKKKKHA
jgi:excinuclease ABC subunit B